jgi:hypothetical protein
VNVEGSAEPLEVQLLDRAERSAVSGIVDQAVESAESINSFRDEVTDLRFLGDVGAAEARGRPDLGGECVTSTLLTAGQEHPRPMVGQDLCRPGAEAAGCAGNDGDLAGQLLGRFDVSALRHGSNLVPADQ